MAYPAPKRVEGKWEVDLRSFGFGWHYVLGPETLPEAEAIHLAWAKLEALRAAGKYTGEHAAQLELRARGSAPELTAGAIDEWQRLKDYRTDGGKVWGDKVATMIRREIGAVPFASWCQAGGQARLVQYVRDCAAAGLGSRSVRNRMAILGQVFDFALEDERRWLNYRPTLPRSFRLPKKPPPRYDWIPEGQFRDIRARMFAKANLGKMRVHGDPRLYVARRKVYVSILFYTGMRHIDVDEVTGDQFGMDTETYVATWQKTTDRRGRFEMPEPLVRDLWEYLKFVGRDYFEAKEPIGGGPWTNVGRVLARASARYMNPMLLRRSYAREMFLRGYTIEQVAARMGHVDTSMLREVYVDCGALAGEGRVESKWRAPTTSRPAPRGAQVIDFSAAAGAAGAKGRKTKGE